MDKGTKRADIHVGLKVSIVLKQDQRSGKLTEGIVRNILTKCMGSNNPHNVVKATITGLKQLQSRQQVAARRGIKVEDL